MNSKNPKWNSIVPQPQKLDFLQGELEQLHLNVSGPFAAEAQKFAARHPQLAQAAQGARKFGWNRQKSSTPKPMKSTLQRRA